MELERPVCALSATLMSFVSVVDPSTQYKYNLAWAYGDYLLEIPKRLGTNKALDAAAETMVEAHRSACLRQPVTTDCLVNYSRALEALRVSLDDAVTAGSAETLCAVMMLLVCQVSVLPTKLNLRSLIRLPELDGLRGQPMGPMDRTL